MARTFEDHAIEELASRLSASRKTTVLTGAGVSAASGIPTFRGEGGYWRQRPAEELASTDALRREPLTVWEFFLERRRLIAGCSPNRAHEVLAAWSRQLPGFAVLTQNVDSLHQAAGTIGVIELHGSIWEVGCAISCEGSPRRWRDTRLSYHPMPPTCVYCGAQLRPGEVLFGEQLPLDQALRAGQAAERCELMLVIGTTAVVQPVAGLIAAAHANGAFVVEINPEPSASARELIDLTLAGPAERVLDLVDRSLTARIG